MRKTILVVLLCVFALCALSTAQTIQVNRDNKTIYVTAEGEAKAEAEIATITLGYHAWGRTKDEVYDAVAKASENVVAALLDAGVKEEMIRTENTSISHTEPEANWPNDWKINRSFEAELKWKITVPVKDAETIVAIAMKAGATELSGQAWNVVDRTKLQAEASRNALEKARAIAASMAEGLHAKLGALIYASNSAPIRPNNWPFFGTSGTELASLSASQRVSVTPKVIKLFPEKIEEKATVYAVFAIE